MKFYLTNVTEIYIANQASPHEGPILVHSRIRLSLVVIEFVQKLEPTILATTLGNWQ